MSKKFEKILSITVGDEFNAASYNLSLSKKNYKYTHQEHIILSLKYKIFNVKTDQILNGQIL